MASKQDMNTMGEETMNSFRRRDKANRDLVKEVNAMIHRFREEHREMAARLASNAERLHASLSVDEQDRMKDYSAMMGNIQKELHAVRDTVSSYRTEAAAMMQGFAGDRSAMSTELHAMLDDATASRMDSEQIRLGEFGEMMAGIREYNKSLQMEVVDIFASTNAMLERFAGEHEQMAEELKNGLEKTRHEGSEYTKELLAGIRKRMLEISNENLEAAEAVRKGLAGSEAVRMDEYNSLFSRISSEVETLRQSTSAMLKRFSEERAADSAGWPELEVVAVSPQEEVDAAVEEFQDAAPQQEPAEVVNEEPEAEPEAEAASVTGDSLEERVLAYINSSTEGVRVSDMEKPLGETRMKIGVAARNLLDEGKVSKVENFYHPLGH
ncbi:hypothetical protein EKD00_00530 [Chlorobium phaeovibrioides]|uniref:hypothetical protein n=1 Tax=Chlorobium phaeovibrioides TaxID=1094 RepID=UPI000F848BE5|nr:hypothetical protein [Chlorobium phaeovibrioides]RTY37256.1 hypothetical protein EKD00_00530 [Chlorobium phaeovibrioides]